MTMITASSSFANQENALQDGVYHHSALNLDLELDGLLQPRCYRRPAPSSSSSSSSSSTATARISSQYSIVMRNNVIDYDSSSYNNAFRGSSKGSIVKMTIIPMSIQHQPPTPQSSSSPSTSKAINNNEQKLLLCLYEEGGMDHDHTDIDINYTNLTNNEDRNISHDDDGGDDGRYSQWMKLFKDLRSLSSSSSSSASSISKSNNNNTSLNQGEEIVPTEECFYFLQRVISAWCTEQFPTNNSRGKNKNRRAHIPIEDVQHLYNVFAQQQQQQHLHHNHHVKYPTPIDNSMDEDAIVIAISTTLGLNHTVINDCQKHRIASMQQKQQQHGALQSTQDNSKLPVLRLMTMASTISDKNNSNGDTTFPKMELQPFKFSHDTIAFPLSSKKIPLISITLHPKEEVANDKSNNNNNNNDSDIFSDALLRACIKRLLVGKILLHSNELPKHGRKEALSFRTCCLSVKVPRQQPSFPNDNKSRYQKYDFRVADVQSTRVGNATQLPPTLFVILPSTRIIFQSPAEEKKGICPSTDGNEQQQQQQSTLTTMHNHQPVVQIPPLPLTSNNASPSTPSKLMLSPHEHLVESLQSILFFQSHQYQKSQHQHDQRQLRHQRHHPPPIPRSFLFSGPPGVGKTYSVKRAISIVNNSQSSSNLPTSTTTTSTSGEGNKNDAVRLISLRGSELLASSSSSGGNYATAARELERQFQTALNLCNSSNRSRGSTDHSGDDDGEKANAKAVVVFLDECDALVSSSIVAAMLAAILDKMEFGTMTTTINDDSSSSNNSNKRKEGWERVLLIAATNRVDAIPGYLRRPGRLEKEIVVSPPNVEKRLVLLKGMLALGSFSSGSSSVDNNTRSKGDSFSCVGSVEEEEGLQRVAEACVGYVAADLSALVRRAAILGIEKAFHDDDDQTSSNQLFGLGRRQHAPTITARDLFSAMNDVGASCLRDASLSAPPKTTWNDIAGDAGGAKRALREAIEWPRTRRSAFLALGLNPPRGVLLHGPPGCAKTTLARAAAGAAGVAFLSLSPADVYASSYVGEAEGVVRRAFDLARAAAPCVLFFDEIDAIIGGEDEGGGKGGGHGMGRGSSAEARVLSTFLNEMDGIDGSVEDGVLVLGATNRPRILDAALLRPGRFDRVIYVPPPDQIGRRAIFSMECKKWHDALLAYASSNDASQTFSRDVDLSTTGSIEKYFDVDMLASDPVSGSMTGAEIVGACRETAVQIMRTMMHNSSKSVESLLLSLMEELESSLRSKTPLLSNVKVLEEYTRFEDERK